MSFPKEAIPHPALQDDGVVLVVLTTTQKFNFPPGVTTAEIEVQGGGAASSGGAVANVTAVYSGHAGACGISVITVDPNVDYLAVVGAASIAPGAASASAGTAGNLSSFSGRGIVTITGAGGLDGSTNVQAVATGAQVSIPGGFAIQVPPGFHMGGTSRFGCGGRYGGSAGYAPSASYGSGSAPPLATANSGLAGNNGQPGVITIRYRGQS